jgi:hypothetical protein
MDFPGKDKAFRKMLSKGDVFIKNFKGIDHPKYFVVAGISLDKVCVCAFFINSNIPDFMYTKPKLLNLQVNIKGSKYDFLTHDSFVSCSTPIKKTAAELVRDCNYAGRMDDDDLENIVCTVIHSNMLTEYELDLYFPQR